MAGIRGEDERLISAGKFRKDRARVTGASFRPSAPEDIEKHLKGLVEEYNVAKERGIHPVELASVFHQKFEKIHPFADGNGRTGRAILNFILAKNGFPRMYILPAQRKEYLRALQEADYGNNAPLVDFTIQRIISAITYFYAKTSAYDALKLPQLQKLFATLYGKDVAGVILTRLDYFKESNEFP
jgi:Fic family protein